MQRWHLATVKNTRHDKATRLEEETFRCRNCANEEPECTDWRGQEETTIEERSGANHGGREVCLINSGRRIHFDKRSKIEKRRTILFNAK